MSALFPGYMRELASSAMIKRSIDDAIERRESCISEPIERHLTTDHVSLRDDYSDTQLAELFLHHRVLVIPVATQGRVHAIVTRGDFFRALAERFLDRVSSSRRGSAERGAGGHPHQVALGEDLGELHRVSCSALAEVVADDPHVEAAIV